MFGQLFGKHLVKKGILTEGEYREAVEAHLGRRVKIGTIAIAEGLLTQEQVIEIHRQQRQYDRLFGDIAIDNNFLTKEQVEEGDVLVSVDVASPGMLPKAFAHLLGNIQLPNWMLCSFPIYAMHDIFVETLNKVFSFFVSPASNWILLDFFITTIVSIGICIAINEFLKRYMPKFQSLIFGGRTR